MSSRIAILGSTGSIGRNTLKVIDHLGAPYRAVALSGHRQTEILIEQAQQYRPAAVAVADEQAKQEISGIARDIGAEIYAGTSGLCDLAGRADVDTVLSAIVGAAGVAPAFAAVRAGKKLALANK